MGRRLSPAPLAAYPKSWSTVKRACWYRSNSCRKARSSHSTRIGSAPTSRSDQCAPAGRIATLLRKIKWDGNSGRGWVEYAVRLAAILSAGGRDCIRMSCMLEASS